MGFKFNVFTSNFDLVEGGSVTTWLPPVNTRNDLPSGDSDGAARVVLDEDTVFVYDNAADEWHNTRLSEAQFDAVANSEGISIDSVTTSGKVDYRVNLHPADSSNPGAVSTGAQNFAGDKTFDNNVIVTGDLTVNGTTTSVNSQTLDVADANITVNNGGDQASANLNDAGLTVEMSDATDAIIGYDSTLTSKFAIGEVGSTAEIADVSSNQVITNKDLSDSSNILTGASADNLRRETGNQNLFTIPDSGSNDNFVLEAFAQILQNKTLDNTNDATLLDNNFTLQDNVDNTKQAQFRVDLVDTATTRIYDLPNGSDELLGKTLTQTIENKTIDGTSATGNNSVLNDATDVSYNNGTSGLAAVNAQEGIDELSAEKIDGPGSSTDNAVARFDSTSGKVLQNSGVLLNDLDEISGVTQLDVDNLNFNDNDISATNANGNISLIPNGTGHVTLNTSLLKEVVDPVDAQDAATKQYVDDNTTFVPGDLDEVSFNIANNQSVLADVTGVAFANGTVRSANIEYSIAIDATTDVYETGTIEAVQTGSGWSLSVSSTGDNTQVLFDIDTTGQLQYTSANLAGFVSGVIKARATVTSV